MAEKSRLRAILPDKQLPFLLSGYLEKVNRSRQNPTPATIFTLLVNMSQVESNLVRNQASVAGNAIASRLTFNHRGLVLTRDT